MQDYCQIDRFSSVASGSVQDAMLPLRRADEHIALTDKASRIHLLNDGIKRFEKMPPALNPNMDKWSKEKSVG